MDSTQSKNLRRFRDVYEPGTYSRPVTTSEYKASHKRKHDPIIIDNGSYHVRCGFASSDEPSMVFRSVVGRQRVDRTSRVLAGNRITPAELTKMGNLRTEHDKDVVVQHDVEEHVFDEVFVSCGLDGSGSHVAHPVVVSEAVCNPLWSRHRTSELLFECYGVPSVMYGIDGLFSMYQNADKNANVGDMTGLVVRTGFTTSHILPVVNGRFEAHNAKRIDVGGSHMTDLLLRLMQMKYLYHRQHFSVPRAEEVKRDYCYVAGDYQKELSDFAALAPYDERTVVIQLPYQKKEEEVLTAEEKALRAEKRRKLNIKLREMARQRQEKKEAEELQQYHTFKALLDLKDRDEHTLEQQLRFYQFEDVDDLEDAVAHLRRLLKNRGQLDDEANGAEADDSAAAAAEVEPGSEEDLQRRFPLYYRTDAGLSDDDKRRKRMESARRASYLARIRRQQQQAEKDEEEERKRKEEEQHRLDNPEEWLDGIRKEWHATSKRMEARRKRRIEMKDRRSALSRRRLSELAKAAQETKMVKKRGRMVEEEDTFGMDDEDWDVYKFMGNQEDSESENEDKSRLDDLMRLLQDYDPHYTAPTDDAGDPYAGVATHSFGASEEEYHQVHLGVERFRVPEIVMQPSIIGCTQMGIPELASFVLQKYPADIQAKLMQNIFVTGGCATIPGFGDRLGNDVRQYLPFQSIYDIRLARDPCLDAWKGAALFARNHDQLQACSITRAQYDEMGHGYLQENFFSNRYF